MPFKGLSAITQKHESNAAGQFEEFKIEKDKQSAQLRVLVAPEEWDALYIHREFKTCLPTRCAANILPGGTEDRTSCVLCMHQVSRALRTMIPVRVRGVADPSVVHYIEYGRDSLQEVIANIENLPQDAKLTDFDFRVTRYGTGKDTSYKWFLVHETRRPLGTPPYESELTLSIKTLDELWPIFDDVKMMERAKKHFEQQNVTPVGSDAPAAGAAAAAPAVTSLF